MRWLLGVQMGVGRGGGEVICDSMCERQREGEMPGRQDEGIGTT